MGCLMSNLTIAQNIPDGSTLNSAWSGPGAETRPIDYNSLPNTAPSLFNYNRVYRPSAPMSSVPSFGSTQNDPSIHVSTRYTDGFGRTMMSILRNGTSKDIISINDLRAQEVEINYLPYTIDYHSKFQNTASTDQTSYYTTRYTQERENAYSKTERYLENKVPTVRSYAPGREFVGDERGVTSTVYYNEANEVYILSLDNGAIKATAYYAPNELTVVKTEHDEHNKKSVSYIDKSGKTICVKTYDAGTSSGSTGWLWTYYMYDIMENLQYMIPPKAVALLTGVNSSISVTDKEQLCFAYEYDKNDNIIKRYVPGKADPDEVIYDENFIGVMNRNAKLTAQNKWYFSIYDKQGRVVMTGLYDATNFPTTNTRAYWEGIIAGTQTPVTRSVANNLTLEYWLANYFSGTTYPASLDDCELHTVNYYDDYAHFANGGVDNLLPSGVTPNFDGQFDLDYLPHTGTNMVRPEPYDFTHGKLVASQTRILDNGITNNFVSGREWITSVYFYDEFGRVIQTQVQNPWNTGDWDVNASQYNFSGQLVLDITKYYSWGTSNKPTTKIQNHYIYGVNTGRLDVVKQKIDDGYWQPIAGNNYDELWRLKIKWLGNVEEQVYDYNLRGQLTGINKDELFNTTSNTLYTKTFFEELNYEQGFSQKRYDGSISGFQWRVRGSDPMAYGYSYDEDGRMTAADFREYNGGTPTWNNTNTDFSVWDLSYDMNGNILGMKQKGYDQNYAKTTIDELTYDYTAGNQLQNVTDAIGNVSAPDIYDFVDGNTHASTSLNDYEYDESGNLKKDRNKDITNIDYTHFNLPSVITKGNGDNVQNIYTATGTLLQKTITENSTPVTYRYWGPFEYKDDVLEFLTHSEGRARYIPGVMPEEDLFKYDFFVRDHLGNVRTVVEGSSTFDQLEYHAGFEIIAAPTEEAIFDQIGNVRDIKPQAAPDDQSSGKLNGSMPGKEIGAALLVHSMAGDQLNLQGYGYYEDEDPNNYNTYATAETMLGSLTTALTGATGEGAEGGPNTTLINNMLTTSNYTAYNTLKTNATNPNYPRAYLNYLVFSEHFELETQYSKVVQISSGPGNWQLMDIGGNQVMPINGYILIYFSNESNINVFVDNAHMIQNTSNLKDEKHYYPHGLVIEAGSNPMVTPENTYLFESNKIQRELGLHNYDFNARQYDPQIGRFTSIDPMADFAQENVSPYHFVHNDPANRTDPTGMFDGPGPQKLMGATQTNNKNRSGWLAKLWDNIKAAGGTGAWILAGGGVSEEIPGAPDWRGNRGPGGDIDIDVYTKSGASSTQTDKFIQQRKYQQMVRAMAADLEYINQNDIIIYYRYDMPTNTEVGDAAKFKETSKYDYSWDEWGTGQDSKQKIREDLDFVINGEILDPAARLMMIMTRDFTEPSNSESVEAGLEAANIALTTYTLGTSALFTTATTATTATTSSGTLTTVGLKYYSHAITRMSERGITRKMVEVTLRKGIKYYDPLNKSFNYVLRGSFSSGKSIVIGVDNLGYIKTVIRTSRNPVKTRFILMK